MIVSIESHLHHAWGWLRDAAYPLQSISSGAQLGLILIALVSVYYARRQINAFKLSQLVTYLQEEGFRNSRRTVIQDIWEKRGTKWWNDRALEVAASTCAGHYDVVGNLLKYTTSGKLRRFVIRSWSESIVRIHETLGEFMAERRRSGGNSYEDFDWLYKRAKRYKRNVGDPWPPLADKFGG